jgi:hypothetical protein
MELIAPLVSSMRALSTPDTRIMITLEERDPYVFEEAFKQFAQYFEVKKVRSSPLFPLREINAYSIYFRVSQQIRKNKLPKMEELQHVDAYELSKLPDPEPTNTAEAPNETSLVQDQTHEP